MKLHYGTETDSLYIDLNERPSVDSREIADGLVVDFDADGRVVTSTSFITSPAPGEGRTQQIP